MHGLINGKQTLTFNLFFTNNKSAITTTRSGGFELPAKTLGRRDFQPNTAMTVDFSRHENKPRSGGLQMSALPNNGGHDRSREIKMNDTNHKNDFAKLRNEGAKYKMLNDAFSLSRNGTGAESIKALRGGGYAPVYSLQANGALALYPPAGRPILGQGLADSLTNFLRPKKETKISRANWKQETKDIVGGDKGADDSEYDFVVTHMDAAVAGGAAAVRTASDRTGTAGGVSYSVSESHLDGLGSPGPGDSGRKDAEDDGVEGEFDNDAMPVLEITHQHDVVAVKLVLAHVVQFGSELEQVPMARHVEEDKLKSVSRAKRIGIKLPEYDEVLAIVEDPRSVEQDGHEVLMAGKIQLTSAVKGELLQELFGREKSEELMPFSLDEPEFDLSTFTGRYKNNVKVSNQRHAYYSNKKIKEFQQLIEDQKKKERQMFKLTKTKKVMLPKDEIKQLRIAQSVISTAINPDTGDFIPWAARMSSFLPLNLPISFGLIITPPTPFNTVLWQWVNQTYNAQCNYGNRNASSKYTAASVLRSYLLACTTSISVALFTRYMVSSWTRTMAGGILFVFNSITAYLATATAGFINASMMRATELTKGISVYDPSNMEKPVVTSKSAARRAVFQTATSRFILPAPMIAPAIILFAVEKVGLMPPSFFGKTLLQMSLFAAKLYFSLPLCISAYPPIGRIKADEFKFDSEEVQKAVAEYKNKKGEPVTYFQYNKGL